MASDAGKLAGGCSVRAFLRGKIVEGKIVDVRRRPEGPRGIGKVAYGVLLAGKVEVVPALNVMSWERR